MDKFKEKTMNDYTAWDINCPRIVKRTKGLKKLRTIFKRKARRNLKREIERSKYGKR